MSTKSLKDSTQWPIYNFYLVRFWVVSVSKLREFIIFIDGYVTTFVCCVIPPVNGCFECQWLVESSFQHFKIFFHHGKNVRTLKKMILTRERLAKPLLAGQNKPILSIFYDTQLSQDWLNRKGWKNFWDINAKNLMSHT